jgi:Fe-S oxidoreductase
MTTSLGQSIDKATAYCTYCPKLCRHSCPAAEAEDRETVTPWGMMRLLEMVKEGTVEPSDEVAEVFYHCMGCRACQTWCKHDNDVPEAMWAARAWMRDLGYVPELLRGFSEFFLEENSPHPVAEPLAEVSVESPEEVFDPEGTFAFFPDCETRYHYPELVTRTGRLLEKVLGEKVRLMTRDEGEGHACCGFPLLSAGDEAGYEAYRAELDSVFGQVDTVFTDCAAFASLYREDGSFGRPGSVEVVHIIELLAEYADTLEVEKVPSRGLMLHDSCFVGRHLDLFDATRKVVEAICDEPPAEFHVNRDKAPCCGGPSHYHVVAREASQRAASARMEQMETEGGSAVVCGSATCKKAFRRVRDEEAAVDILELACRAMGV